MSGYLSALIRAASAPAASRTPVLDDPFAESDAPAEPRAELVVARPDVDLAAPAEASPPAPAAPIVAAVPGAPSPEPQVPVGSVEVRQEIHAVAAEPVAPLTETRPAATATPMSRAAMAPARPATARISERGSAMAMPAAIAVTQPVPPPEAVLPPPPVAPTPPPARLVEARPPPSPPIVRWSEPLPPIRRGEPAAPPPAPQLSIGRLEVRVVPPAAAAAPPPRRREPAGPVLADYLAGRAR